MFRISFIVFLCICGYVLISCAINPVTGKRQLMLMSQDQEVQLRISYDPRIIATFGVYPDKKLQDFVQSRGAELGIIYYKSIFREPVAVIVNRCDQLICCF